MRPTLTAIIIILMLTVPPFFAYKAGMGEAIGREFCADIIGNDPLKIRD